MLKDIRKNTKTSIILKNTKQQQHSYSSQNAPIERNNPACRQFLRAPRPSKNLLLLKRKNRKVAIGNTSSSWKWLYYARARAFRYHFCNRLKGSYSEGANAQETRPRCHSFTSPCSAEKRLLRTHAFPALFAWRRFRCLGLGGIERLFVVLQVQVFVRNTNFKMHFGHYYGHFMLFVFNLIYFWIFLFQKVFPINYI